MIALASVLQSAIAEGGCSSGQDPSMTPSFNTSLTERRHVEAPKVCMLENLLRQLITLQEQQERPDATKATVAPVKGPQLLLQQQHTFRPSSDAELSPPASFPLEEPTPVRLLDRNEKGPKWTDDDDTNMETGLGAETIKMYPYRCKYFNKPRGCRNGDSCRFIHSNV